MLSLHGKLPTPDKFASSLKSSARPHSLSRAVGTCSTFLRPAHGNTTPFTVKLKSESLVLSTFVTGEFVFLVPDVLVSVKEGFKRHLLQVNSRKNRILRAHALLFLCWV